MTCQHAAPAMQGTLGDLIHALCPCGHWWLICDEWLRQYGDRTAFERCHPTLARRVTPGMVERSEPLRVEVM